MRAMIGALLLTGLLAGCGGTEMETPATVKAASCDDCHWLYVRCMSRATTAEAKENCEIGRMDCEATFCPDPPAREDALSAEKASTSEWTTLPYCYQLDALACGAIGTKRSCTDGIGGTYTCYCRGEWDCPPYEETLTGK
ncbi:hypothetical protein [Archangium lipolyticum]|uniref:hypothetical protein n=1 Tax=Archangium lipolyticum TaxID=2970465 RepID=UPI002149ACAD|nr:hypothetical protein [Archangium lipolyticum]